MTDNANTKMRKIGYRPPENVAEPDELVLVEYVSGGRVAVITLNRPHADNAVTTELAAQLIEVLETIAARPSVRVAILTGAGDRAFSVGGDLYQRKNMTKEEWLRQRQVFDRVLYNLRQVTQADLHRCPRDGLRRWLRDGHQHGLHHRLRGRPLRPARSDGRFVRRWRLAGLSSACPPAGEGHADADDRGTDHRPGGVPAGHGQ